MVNHPNRAKAANATELLAALLAIDTQLHVALVQRIPSDDAIIMGHVEKAKAIAADAIKKAKGTPL